MTHRFVVWMIFIATLAGGARAMLPPDAKARAPQLRAYYQQVRIDSETARTERLAEQIRASEQAEVDISTPPWLRGEQNSIQVKAEAAANAAAKRARERIHRILISIMFLSLIVGAAGWVWYKTREMDG
jgi:hypothetical protein